MGQSNTEKGVTMLATKKNNAKPRTHRDPSKNQDTSDKSVLARGERNRNGKRKRAAGTSSGFNQEKEHITTVKTGREEFGETDHRYNRGVLREDLDFSYCSV